MSLRISGVIMMFLMSCITEIPNFTQFYPIRTQRQELPNFTQFHPHPTPSDSGSKLLTASFGGL